MKSRAMLRVYGFGLVDNRASVINKTSVAVAFLIDKVVLNYLNFLLNRSVPFFRYFSARSTMTLYASRCKRGKGWLKNSLLFLAALFYVLLRFGSCSRIINEESVRVSLTGRYIFGVGKTKRKSGVAKRLFEIYPDLDWPFAPNK